jgi:hypothetical protein
MLVGSNEWESRIARERSDGIQTRNTAFSAAESVTILTATDALGTAG